MRRRILKRLKQVHGLWPGYAGGTWTLRFDAPPSFGHEAIGAVEAVAHGTFDPRMRAVFVTLREALIEAEAKRAGA